VERFCNLVDEDQFCVDKFVFYTFFIILFYNFAQSHVSTLIVWNILYNFDA